MYTDFLIKIKNAERAGKKSVKVPATEMNKAIAVVLKEKGFIKEYEVKGRLPKRYLDIELTKESSISGLKLVSKPSERHYVPYRKVKKIKGGFGMVVLSTSKGVMHGEQARKEKVGGEILFEMW